MDSYLTHLSNEVGRFDHLVDSAVDVAAVSMK